MPLADYQALVDDLVRDDSGRITAVDRDAAIDLAVKRYGKDRPRRKVEDIAASGTSLIDLPAGWQVGFSGLVSIEFPIGKAPPTLIPQDRVDLYDTPTATKILMLDPPAAAAPMRATYTIRHLLDAVDDTIPIDDREAVGSYAGAILLDELAAFFSGETNSTIAADAVEHGSKAENYAARARALRQKYLDQLGLDPKRNIAAGVVVALDPRDSLGGERLTHRLRT